MSDDLFVFPASFAQQRLWFLDQLEPDKAIYNMPSAYYLQGRLNLGALQQSLNRIITRHESLRTKFTAMDGEPFQVILPVLTLSIPVADLSGLAEAERETAAGQSI